MVATTKEIIELYASGQLRAINAIKTIISQSIFYSKEIDKNLIDERKLRELINEYATQIKANYFPTID